MTTNLCEFFGLPDGTTLSKSEARQKMSEYIHTNKLDPVDTDGGFMLDEKLQSLLGTQAKYLGYDMFSIYMDKHMIDENEEKVYVSKDDLKELHALRWRTRKQ